ncbi:MAG: zinc-binding alcohol dehydrogenase family protein [Acetobacteraceae bacterium]|nr:zinc-binding alcohol dehydrogenase family protein [Acetobacteraceae bacterium]
MKAVGYIERLPIEDARSLLDLDLSDPTPGPRDLLVRVEAVSVNPRDIKTRLTQEGAPDKPIILGYDASGVVEAVGADARLFRRGDPVFYAGSLNRRGSNAELQLVDERIVGRKPASLGHAEAASLPLTSLTAYEMLFDRLGIEPGAGAGAALLMLGGAGGVPSVSIQLARALTGLTVVGTASRPESEQWVRQCGAHYVIDHTRPLAGQVDGLGTDPVVYVFSTHTDARNWAEIAKLIAPQGRLGLIDDPEPLDLRLFKFKSVSIHWEAMFTRPMFGTPDMIRQHEILNEVAALVDRGLVRPTGAQNFGKIDAANLRRPHAAIEQGHVIGKIVLAGF